MSQVRDHLNPGLLEGDLLGGNSGGEGGIHVQSEEDEDDSYSAVDNNNIQPRRCRLQRSHNLSEGDDGKDDGFVEENPGGHDSDPPIENQNPEDGDVEFQDEKHYVEDGESGDAEGGAGGRKKAQFHHRKRKNSIRNSDGSYVPPYKKNRFRRQMSVLPSKFLLGGNIRDPLNLASLADAKVNAELNRLTPASSPAAAVQQQRPVPQNNPPGQLARERSIEPRDDSGGDTAGRQTKHKRRHRRRHGRRRTDSECSVSTSTDAVEEEEEPEPAAEVKTAKKPDKPKESANREKSESESAEPIRSVANPPRESQSTMQPVTVSEQSKTGEDKEKEPVVAHSSQRVPRCSRRLSDEIEDREAVPSVPVQEKEETVRESEVAETPKTNGVDADELPNQSGVYPCKSSEYVPLSSSYAPSPYIFDAANPEECFEVKPFESPSLTNYCCNAATPSHLMEPFSPPPRPEIPHFQRRMQMMSSIPHRHAHMSLQRAVFQKPFYHHHNRRRFRHKSDPIVSPVIPQPGCSNRRNHHHNHSHRHGGNKKGTDKQGNCLNTSSTSTNSNHSTSSKKGNPVKMKQMNGTHQPGGSGASNRPEIKNFRPKDEIYQFGNYKQYYGYRTTAEGDDSRLWILKKDWFRGKDVLDIGCNIGHVTLSIARDFEAKRVHGIDIDNNLITTARKNIKHYMIHDPNDKSIVFPHSLPMIYGAMQPPTGMGKAPQHFPFNVMFSQENYVLSNDALLETVKPEYDVIICLSVTKWIHLNFGDDGLKRFFHRIYRHLQPGGNLILEPQEWSSYYRKRKLTAKISENYKNIKFMPDQFQSFLEKEVGFTFIQKLGTPHHSKGFQRPILIFSKQPANESEGKSSDPSPNATSGASLQ